MVTFLPHGKDVGPPLATTRGVSVLTPLPDVRRIYGTPDKEANRTWFYTREGIAFWEYRGHVGGIVVFRPGAPPTWGGP